MANRERGYYWIVRVKDRPWRIAEWSGGLWWIGDQAWYESDIYEVYEQRIPYHK